MQRHPVVRVGHRLVHFYVRGYHRLHLLNPCPLPPRGPGILVCNHISGLDPVLLQAATDRLLTWMMAREYYEMKGFRWFYDAIGAIPVERTGRDLASTRAAFRALEEGRVIGLFPEGKISTTSDVLPFQVGVALLALRSGAPVYPAYLDGSPRGTTMFDAFFRPHTIRLRFGPPLQFTNGESSRRDMTQVSEVIRNSVIALQNDIERG